jgi:starch synthase
LLRCNGRNEAKPVAHELQCASVHLRRVRPIRQDGRTGRRRSRADRRARARGHEVLSFIPLHGQINLRGARVESVEALQRQTLAIGAREFVYDVKCARHPGAPAAVHLIDCPPLFDRPQIYSDGPDEYLRYLMLTRAALESCQRLGFAPDIVHCNDWHTALAPLLLRSTYAWDRQIFGRTRSVFTIHNIGYQGSFRAGHVADLGPGVGRELLYQEDLAAGWINPMRHGVMYADAVTTVSPTYAREIRTPAAGFGLDADLRARGDAVVGILNGVDYSVWNPATDPFLPHNYDQHDLSGKSLNKLALTDLLRLGGGAGSPLIGMVTRLTSQKGIDLLMQVLPALIETRELRFVALGTGDTRYERFFDDLQQRFPGRAVFHAGYSEELAHFIEGAADMFLMPSYYEPSGLNQMYSLRYGTVPVVRNTGGLADSVQQYDPDSGEGTGIVFNDFDAGGLGWALDTALEWYEWPDLWSQIIANGMRQDFSWQRAVGEYERLYSSLQAIARV